MATLCLAAVILRICIGPVLSMDLQVYIYHSFDAKLEGIWRSLEDSCDHFVFQSYEWLSHWQRTVGRNSYGIEPSVVVVSDSRRPLALFPFGIRRTGGVRVLEFLGGEQNDYNAPLILPEVSEPDQFRALWNTMLDSLPGHDVRYFTRMPQQLGNLQNPILGIAPSFCEGVAYAATLPDSWEIFRQRLPARFQKDNARMIRRLSEMGQFEFVIASTASEFGNIVEAVLTQKERQYTETGARNIFSDINTCSFYRELRSAIERKGDIHLSALILNGDILAAHFGMVYRDRFYYLLPSFARGALEKFSPGRLLLENLVQWAISHRLKIFDFTCGGESYKQMWCDLEMPFYRSVQPLTLRGYAFAQKQGLILWVKTNPRARAIAMSGLRMLHSFQRKWSNLFL